MSPTTRWRVLQIADSAFPVGGFAHSAGLEAMVHHGWPSTVVELDTYVAAHLWNVGHSSLPFVGAAYDAPADLVVIDRRLDALLSNHVANRASRTQGRAFIATAARVFDDPEMGRLAQLADGGSHAHLAPLFGAAMATLGLSRREALTIHLHSALRGLLSAAVRLAVIGPHEAARMHDRRSQTLEAVLGECAELTVDGAATVVPLLDVVWTTHDGLYARLFQS
ncbi:MAG TPA: urease accessory UreF family protein [Polyangiaceae bacterium]|nr:urease accessory UreF family protein [Polyangiaceae bacterium]